jgi:hypothetical protein
MVVRQQAEHPEKGDGIGCSPIVGVPGPGVRGIGGTPEVSQTLAPLDPPRGGAYWNGADAHDMPRFLMDPDANVTFGGITTAIDGAISPAVRILVARGEHHQLSLFPSGSAAPYLVISRFCRW